MNGNRYLEEYAYTNYGAVTGKQLTVTKKLANGTDASTAIAATWSYDGEGRPLTVGYPMSGPTYQYTWDARGMPSRLQRVSGADVVASVGYGPAGEMTSMTMGPGGGSEGRTYNINGQMTQLTLPGRTINYNFPVANNGKVASITDSGETINYSYDALNRLTSASVTSVWSQDFVYDGFGNLTGKTGTGGAPSWTPVNGVNPANNRLLGLTYDANGNQETIPMTAGMPDAFTASYDIDNRMTQMVNASQSRKSEYDYDASNKRVWERRTGGPDAGEWVYFFGADGSRMGRYAVTVGASSISLSQNQASVWFAGKLVQKVGSNWASPTWPNEDRLASVGRYLPYGEDKPGASNPANDNEKFATYTRDAGTGIDYADQRWYGQGTGRFTTSDPLADSASPKDSLSWNRYSYTKDDPINGADPTGEVTIIVTGTTESNPEWARQGSLMWNRIRDIFAESEECVVRYDWPASLSSTIIGTSIINAVNGLALTVQRAMASCPGQPLNMVGYSHGGNVIATYSSTGFSPPIANVITMGTPVRPDFGMGSNVGRVCTVSVTNDAIQFLGASAIQIGIAGAAYEQFVAYEAQAWLALLQGDEQEAFRLQVIAAGWFLTAQSAVLSTRLRPGATNYTIGSLADWPVSRDSHTAVRSNGVWDAVTSQPGWGCRATP